MRACLITSTLLFSFVSTGVLAQAEPAITNVAASKYTTATTEIGTLLDDPAARQVMKKHLPELVASSNLDMVRSMTLRALQQFSADKVTDAVLAAIDAEFVELPAAK